MEINELLTEHCNLFTNTHSNSCLRSPMNRGAWRATYLRGIAKSQTWLRTTTHTASQGDGNWYLSPNSEAQMLCSRTETRQLQHSSSGDTAWPRFLGACWSLSFPLLLPQAMSYCPRATCFLTPVWSSWRWTFQCLLLVDCKGCLLFWASPLTYLFQDWSLLISNKSQPLYSVLAKIIFSRLTLHAFVLVNSYFEHPPLSP